MANDNTVRDSERENNAIYVLNDARRHKDDEILRHPNVSLSFADASDQNYVSVSGIRPEIGENRKVAM